YQHVYKHSYKSLAYDPIADFAPLSQVATFDLALAVGPQAPAKSLKELVDWVKANPARASYGIPAAGSLPHFFGLLFGQTAGLDLRHVGYRGSAAAPIDLIAGQLPIVVTTTADLLEQHKAARICVLATSDRQRSPFLPDVPTFKEAGYDIGGTGWYGTAPLLSRRMGGEVQRHAPGAADLTRRPGYDTGKREVGAKPEPLLQRD